MKLIKKIFQRKPKRLLIEGEFNVIEAFEWRGEKYYMFEDPLNVLTGRGLTAMVFLEEMVMRCNADYLKYHTEAFDKVFSDPKKLNIPALVKLNENLKQRVGLLVALPEQVYKLASIVFFTKDESPYKYDVEYNRKKIEEWKTVPEMYDFFLQTPLKTLIPAFQLQEEGSLDYMRVVEKIDKIHMRDLQEVLSRST